MTKKEISLESFEMIVQRIRTLFAVGKEEVAFTTNSSHDYTLFRLPRTTRLLSSLQMPKGQGEEKVSRSDKKPLFVQLDLPRVESDKLSALDLAALHTEELCTEEKELFLSVLTSLLDSEELSGERFWNVKLKEHEVALRQLEKTRQKERPEPKTREFFLYEEQKEEENSDEENMGKWVDYLQKQEKHQFQVSRVIRFLST